jgi:hypothetical protein
MRFVCVEHLRKVTPAVLDAYKLAGENYYIFHS